jgi:hypothetical protein
VGFRSMPPVIPSEGVRDREKVSYSFVARSCVVACRFFRAGRSPRRATTSRSGTSRACARIGIRMGRWLSPLGRRSLRVGTGALGSSAASGRALGSPSLGTSPRWLGAGGRPLAIDQRLSGQVAKIHPRSQARDLGQLSNVVIALRIRHIAELLAAVSAKGALTTTKGPRLLRLVTPSRCRT